jgi:non-ribosomal peptide synthase protein (TIGR01720 family)
MLRAIPHKGIGFGCLNKAERLPPIVFNYLGQLGSQANQGTSQDTSQDTSQGSTKNWQIVNEGAGEMSGLENQNDLLLNINGAVQNGVLQFGVSSQLSQNQTSTFIEAFEAALMAVTAQGQLSAQAGGVKTPSDFKVKGLSIDRLLQLEKTLTENVNQIFFINSDQTNETEV